MLHRLEEYLSEANAFTAENLKELEEFRLRFLGKKGILNDLFAKFKEVPVAEKKTFGEQLNKLKALVSEVLETQKAVLETARHIRKYDDLTRPGTRLLYGSRHPISIVKNDIINIFSSIGFTISEGPEIEDDWHNFTALNLPDHHPARDMQDSFFVRLNPDVLLRTHTSSVQVRYMESHQPPIRTISPGRVFRNEAVSARSHCMFHQIEGLYIDENVSFSELKATLLYFCKKMFGKSKIRLRPSYFPFTEPSAELDIYWGLNTEVDYRITKGTGWLEILGCGMVDPQVFKNCNIDSERYTGYAFGMGIERIAMLLYQIGDIRMFYENDIRFLQQFRGA